MKAAAAATMQVVEGGVEGEGEAHIEANFHQEEDERHRIEGREGQ